MNFNMIKTTANAGLAKGAVQCSLDTFVVDQTLVLRINPVSYQYSDELP